MKLETVSNAYRFTFMPYKCMILDEIKTLLFGRII